MKNLQVVYKKSPPKLVALNLRLQKETALRLRKLAKAKNRSVAGYIEALFNPTKKK